MRILGSLLDIVKAAVQQHLGPPLFSADFLPALLDPAVKPEPIRNLVSGFTIPLDLARLVTVDLDATPFKACIKLWCDHDVTYRIGALLLPEVPGLIQTFITIDRQAIILAQTDMAVHPDGTVQINGAETGLTVMTIARRHAEHGKTLVRGDAVRAFSFEVLDETGSWQQRDLHMEVPANLVKEIKED